MRRLLTHLALIALTAAGLAVFPQSPSHGDGTVCTQTDPATGECLVWIVVVDEIGRAHV